MALPRGLEHGGQKTVKSLFESGPKGRSGKVGSFLAPRAFFHLHMDTISIALSKGRIFDETLPLLARAGIKPRENPERSRKLIVGTNRRDLRLIIVRASVTPTYVQHDGADLATSGRDFLAEPVGGGLD